MKKICILGADGQLGKYISKNLLGHKITSFERDEFDISDAKMYFELSKYDIVINAAAYTNVIGAETDQLNFIVNHDSVKNITEYLSNSNVHFIHFSSNMVFTPNVDAIHNENEISSSVPILKYGQAKLLADKSIHESNMKFTIIRPVWLHADGDQNFITKMINFNKKDLSIAIDDIANFTTGNMILRFIYKIIEKNIYGDFNICTNEAVSRYELFELFSKISTIDYNLTKSVMSDYGLDKEKYVGLLMDNSKVKKHIEIFSIEKELKLWWKYKEKR